MLQLLLVLSLLFLPLAGASQQNPAPHVLNFTANSLILLITSNTTLVSDLVAGNLTIANGVAITTTASAYT